MKKCFKNFFSRAWYRCYVKLIYFFINVVKRFPLHKMPTLEVDGNVICQSAAIWRYLANEYGLYGANNKEKLVIDQVDETLRDLKVEVMKIRFSKDTEGRKVTTNDNLGY